MFRVVKERVGMKIMKYTHGKNVGEAQILIFAWSNVLIL